MPSALRDVFRHNAWANQRLLAFLGGRTADQLEASTDAVYGNVVLTMHHLLYAEAAYWCFFSGHMPAYQPESEPATLTQLAGWERDIAARWEALDLVAIQSDRVYERTSRDGSLTSMRGGAIVAQTIHHGNVHREQVSHVLTTLGIEPPDLSLYAYDREASA